MTQRELKDSTGWKPILRTSLLLVVLLGCHGGEHEVAEHHTPEHMPADYPAAVDRLLEMHVEISNGSPRATDQLDVFAEAHDIVRWLPDLAADSDHRAAAGSHPDRRAFTKRRRSARDLFAIRDRTRSAAARVDRDQTAISQFRRSVGR